MSTDTSFIILLDQPEDGYAEDFGWVEATISEQDARQHLAEFTLTEDGGDTGAIPAGPACLLYLAPDKDSSAYPDEQRWFPCEPDAPNAVKFWQIDCSVSTPPYQEEPER